MIAGGQALGVASLAASGKDDLVTMFIGGNDFRAVFEVLATQGPDAAIAALQQAVPNAVFNIATAAGTVLSQPVLETNPDVRLVLTTIPKLSYLPEVRGALLMNPALQPFVDAVDQAVGALNQQIWNIASANSRMAVADFAGLIDDVFSSSSFNIGKVMVDLAAINNPTNDSSCFILNDRIHPGTVGQGLLANLLVGTTNEAFDLHLKGLSTRDILENAGLWHGRGQGQRGASWTAVGAASVFSTHRLIDSGATDLTDSVTVPELS